MSGTDPISAHALSQEVGVAQSTLSRWLRMASTVQPMGGHQSDSGHEPKSTRRWTAAEKLRVVAAASSLSEEELGTFLRREGLHEAQLEDWRQQAHEALGNTGKRRKPKASAEDKKIRALEKELRRKEKALAEVAALLTLKKKADAIWGDEDDNTPSRSGERP
jgi:transposase-like protein